VVSRSTFACQRSIDWCRMIFTMLRYTAASTIQSFISSKITSQKYN
jgi:hypothetical protein